MSEPYLYKAYDLTIAAGIADLPLEVGQGNPDIVICYGEVPDELSDASVRTPIFHAAPSAVILFIPNVAKYWIQNGNQITVQRFSGVTDDQICTYLLGSAFGILLHQRGLLVLHGSAIAVDQCAVLFLGRSGAGKSTLAAAFLKQGYTVITDDICAISAHDQSAYLHPGYPQIKLKSDACEKLGFDPTAYPQFGHQEDLKHRVQLTAINRALRLPIKRIYVLVPHQHDQLCLLPVEGTDLFSVLCRQTYRISLIKGMGLSKQHFRYCTLIANQVPIVRVIRPENGFWLHELVTVIQSGLNHL